MLARFRDKNPRAELFRDFFAANEEMDQLEVVHQRKHSQLTKREIQHRPLMEADLLRKYHDDVAYVKLVMEDCMRRGRYTNDAFVPHDATKRRHPFRSVGPLARLPMSHQTSSHCNTSHDLEIIAATRGEYFQIMRGAAVRYWCATRCRASDSCEVLGSRRRVLHNARELGHHDQHGDGSGTVATRCRSNYR